MAEFECPVVEIKIKSHPSADRLEIAVIEGYECIVLKGEYQTGDRAVYIPEQAIVPSELLENLGLTGRLAGPDKNRVKAIKLRNVLSQGLICPLRFVPDGDNLDLGTDCTERLGIKKYDPPIPAKFSGERWNAGSERTIRYDVQNIKKYPNVFEENEPIVISEKLHGSFFMASLLPPKLWHNTETPNGLVVTSKGLADKGLAIRHPIKGRPLSVTEKFQMAYLMLCGKLLSILMKIKFSGLLKKLKQRVTRRVKELKTILNGRNVKNTYWRIAKHYAIEHRIAKLPDALTSTYFVLGEIFGKGIQDLHYGTDKEPGFRVFDIYKKSHEKPVPYTARFLNDKELDDACKCMGLERVPVLYRGPFSQKVVEKYTSGKETVSGKKLHVREGVVIRPQEERRHRKLGRVQLKSVSEKYLLRKGKTTDFN